MATLASNGQLYSEVSLGQPLPTSTHKKHTFGRKRVPLRRRVVLHHAVRIQSQAGFGRGTVKIKEEESEIETETEPKPELESPSGTNKFFKLPGTIKLPGTVKLQGKGQSQAKSNKVVFVAGATGKVGSRTVRELLKLGFRVKASTRNVEKARAIFEDLEQTTPADAGSDDEAPFGFFSPAKLFGFLKPKSKKMLEIVECDLEDADNIEPALGNTGVVVCCIGASEKEALDVSGPYRIDFKATQNLINAASSAQVSHFVLVTSLGTQKFGFPAAVLNLFWGVLLWKAKAEKALLQSGLPYTIVRPGGMERPTDAYKETHNLILAEADKLFGGQVSNLQVAELLAIIVENPDVSVNKIIEAVAETTAPLRPIKELLEEIPAKDSEPSSPEPQSIRKSRPAKADVAAPKASKKEEEEKLAREKRAQALKEKEEQRIQAEKLASEKLAQAQKEKEEKRIQSEKNEKEMVKLQALRKKYEEEIEAAREKEEAANSAAAAALAEKADLKKKVVEVRAKAEAAALAASQAKAVEAAVLAAARKGNVLSDEEKEKIMESVKVARLPKEDSLRESKPSTKRKPVFSFLGSAAPSSAATETITDKESEKEGMKGKVKTDVETKAKVQADKEAAAKIAEKKEQEEKAKKEEEAKKLAEQEAAKALEAKKKEEQEAAKALEAKKKEELEAANALEKAKKEEEAKKLAEQEAAKALEAKKKVELEAAKALEAKKKEEQDKLEKEAKELAEKAAAKAAEAKKKEEAVEAKRKEEQLAEAKRKEEQERAEKLKLEAEKKAKALAQEAAVQEAAAAEAKTKALQKEEEPEKTTEAPAPARPKGFRWFWQPAEPEVEQTTEPEVTNVPVQPKVTDEQLPQSSTPLSPYARYPGLKPPSPPIASPPVPKSEEVPPPKVEAVSSEINSMEQTINEVGLSAEKDKGVVEEEPSQESQDDSEARKRLVEEIAAREKEALEKAKAAITFKWPWQKEEEESAAPSKDEEATSPAEEVVASPSVQSKEKSSALPPSSRPLSPYAQFPNLKPPAPPRASCPVQNGAAKELKVVETLSSSSTPLSPYPGFPELKPPTTPSPLADEDANGAVPEGAAEAVEKIAEPAVSSGFKWPWQQ